MTSHAGKTKPELWKEIELLEQKIILIELYLERKGLLQEATEYIEQTRRSIEELPFN